MAAVKLPLQKLRINIWGRWCCVHYFTFFTSISKALESNPWIMEREEESSHEVGSLETLSLLSPELVSISSTIPFLFLLEAVTRIIRLYWGSEWIMFWLWFDCITQIHLCLPYEWWASFVCLLVVTERERERKLGGWGWEHKVVTVAITQQTSCTRWCRCYCDAVCYYICLYAHLVGITATSPGQQPGRRRDFHLWSLGMREEPINNITSV